MDDLILQNRQAILEIAARHGISRVRVFGSRARGDSSADSDVDLLIDCDQPKSRFFPAGFIADVSDLLKTKVDVVTEGSLHWYIRDQILKEAIFL